MIYIMHVNGNCTEAECKLNKMFVVVVFTRKIQLTFGCWLGAEMPSVTRRHLSEKRRSFVEFGVEQLINMTTTTTTSRFDNDHQNNDNYPYHYYYYYYEDYEDAAHNAPVQQTTRASTVKPATGNQRSLCRVLVEEEVYLCKTHVDLKMSNYINTMVHIPTTKIMTTKPRA